MVLWALGAPARTGEDAADNGKGGIMKHRHRGLWLIVVFVLMGVGVGAGVWVVLRIVRPGYTAETTIEVLSPSFRDPLEFSSPPVTRQATERSQKTVAAYLKSERLLYDLLELDEVRSTEWFRVLSKDGTATADGVVKAHSYLQQHLEVTLEKDSPFITVALTCYGRSGQHESAMILNKLIELFLRQQDEMAKTTLRARDERLTRAQLDLRKEVEALDTEIDAVFRRSRFPLFDGQGHYLQELLAQVELQRLTLSARIHALEHAAKNSPGAGDTAVADDANAQEGMASQAPEAKTELTALKKQLEYITEESARLNDEARQLTRIQLDLQRLRMKRQACQGLADKVKTVAAKVNMLLRDPAASGLRSTGLVLPPLTATRPRLASGMWAGGILGLIVGLVVCLLRSRSTSTASPPSA